MELKDLETLIAEQADRDLQDSINAAFEPAERFYQRSPGDHMIADVTERAGGSSVSAWHFIRALKEKMFESLRDRHRQGELHRFVQQAQLLQQQINKLCGGESNY